MLSQSFAPFALVIAIAILAAFSLVAPKRRSGLFALRGWDPRLFSRDLASRPQGGRVAIVLTEVSGVSGLVACFKAVSSSFGAGLGTLRHSLMSLALPALAACLVVFCIMATPDTALAASNHLTDGSVQDMTTMAVAGSVAAKLKETNETIIGKSKILHEVMEKSGKDLDFNNADVLKLTGAKDSAEVVEKVKAMNKELDELGVKADGLRELFDIEEKNNKRLNTPTNPIPFPGRKNRNTDDDDERGEPRLMKSLGKTIVDSKAFKSYKESKNPAQSEEEGFGLAELKTLFQTSAGWAPFSPRSNVVIDKATRPIQLLDIIPTGTMKSATFPYMEETTLTDAAAERAEGGAYEESAFALTERTETARSIGSSIPVTDEQLEDVDAAESYLNQRLSFLVRRRVDNQVMLGNGTPPNLQGINGKSGVQTQALGGDSIPDAFFKAMVAVRVTGRAFPNAHVIHPTNWQTVRLLKTLDGIYIFGSPSEAGPDRLWGLQVVQFDGTSAGTGWTGDFANFCQLLERRGLEVAVGHVGDQFKEGKKTIRAGLRTAFAIYRAAAFCKITGM
jgi:HK97 family phage major capsid protein